MKTVTLYLVLTLAMLAPGCSTFLGEAQLRLAPYSFEIVGASDGLVVFNSRVIAIDANTAVTLRYREDGEIKWEKKFAVSTGRRAFQIILSGSVPAIAVIPWEDARLFLPWLPGDPQP